MNFLSNWSVCSLFIVVFCTSKLQCPWSVPTGNQYPVVLLGCIGETTCPKSQKRSRSHMGFELWPSDVSFCVWTISSCFSSCLIALQIVSPAFNLYQLPMMLSAVEACPHAGLFSWRLEELIAMCEGRGQVMVSSHSQLLWGLASWRFFSLQNQQKWG